MKKLVIICSVVLALATSTLRAASASAAAKVPTAQVAETDVKQAAVSSRLTADEVGLSELLYVPFELRFPQAIRIPGGVVPKNEQPVAIPVQHANEAIAAMIDCDVKRAFWHLGNIDAPGIRRVVMKNFFISCPFHKCKASDYQGLRTVNTAMLLGSFFLSAKGPYIPQADFAELLIFVGKRALEYHQHATNPEQDFLVTRYSIQLEALEWILHWTKKHPNFFPTPKAHQDEQAHFAQMIDDARRQQIFVRKNLARNQDSKSPKPN